MELGLNPSMTIEFETLMRNVMVWMLTRTARMTHVLQNVQSEKNSCLDCEVSVSGTRRICFDDHSTLGGHPNGDCLALSESCPDVLKRIQVGPQLRSRNTRNTLDLQHTQGRNLVPLGDGLLGDVERGSELGEPAGCDDGAFKWGF
jgi:hypothetical protein